MNDPREDINYLASSANRVTVLTYLREQPSDRRTLYEESDIARATLSRVLTGFQQRGWITKQGQEYRLTPSGELLTAQFTALLDTVALIQNLHGVAGHLPLDAMGFELRDLHDATITRPSSTDPTAPVQRATELTRDATHIRFLSNIFAPPIAENLWRRTCRGEQTVIAVLTTEVVNTIRQAPEMARLTRETIETEHAEFYRYNGEQPYNIAILDGAIAGIMVLDGEATVRGMLETDDETVRSWVASTIEAYRHEADPLLPTEFTV